MVILMYLIPTLQTYQLATDILFLLGGARSQGCSLLDGTNPTPDAVTLSASGSIVNSSYNYSGLTYTSTNGEGWNLLGNPFPSNINWDASGWTKTNIDNTVYQYIPGTNSYTSWNGAAGTGGVTDGIIPSGGAFFVKANAASPAFSVTQADKTQVNPGAGLFKSLKLSAGIRLKLQNQTGLSDESVITLQNNYTDSYNGNAFDAEKLLNPNGFNIYSILRNGSGKQLVFNGLAPVDVNTGKIIPIGITTPAIGSYQLKINLSEMPYHHEIYLIDSFLSTTTLLTENNSYPFTVTASAQSTGNNRFSIAVQNKLPISTGVNGSALNKTRIQVFPNPANNWLTIGVNNTVKEETTVNVTDMFGKQIMQLTFIGQNHTIDISALAAGAYFVEVQNGNTKNIFKTIKQ